MATCTANSPAWLASPTRLRITLKDLHSRQESISADEFLSNNGKARAIPVFVFYTEDVQYITHFTERPASAQAEIDALLDEVKTRVDLPKTATFSDLQPAEKKEVIARILPRFEQWQRDSIREMRQLLANVLNLPNG